MIYNKSGTEALVAYNANGTALSSAYDLNGNKVLNDNHLVVMSYNVQDWMGINSQQAMQSAIINLYDPDIIGFEEFSKSGSVPTIPRNILTKYPYINMTNHVNYNAIASKLYLTDITVADYETQDPYDVSIYEETRSYIRGYFNKAGKRIAFFCTHLCVRNAEPRYAQMQELFDMAEDEEYCIITGDFNSTDRPLTELSDDYINQYKLFVDAGYHLANNSPTAGFTNTHATATEISSLADLTSALDSIIVSNNIVIDNVIFDPTKISYQNGTKFDHIPVIAYLTIN